MMISLMMAAALVLQAEDTGPGWRGLGWGQTPEQLRAARPEVTAIDAKKDEQVFSYDYLARSETEWQGIPVEVRYHFTPGSRKMMVVKMIPIDKDRCGELEQKSLAQLGTVPPGEQKLSAMSPPGMFERDVTYRWDLPARQSTALYTDIKLKTFHVCHLLFRKR